MIKNIEIISQPEPELLKALGVTHWPVWSKEVSRFPWVYDASESCYFIEGEVLVTTEQGQEVTIQAGDLVTFPAGLSCVWDIRHPVVKHYHFLARDDEEPLADLAAVQ